MYWKFCAMAALENVVAGCWIASPGNAEIDCAKTGDAQATQATPTAKTSRFIESSFVSWIGFDSSHCASARIVEQPRCASALAPSGERGVRRRLQRV